MVTDFKLGIILVTLLFLSFATEASLEEDDYKQCKQKVMNWASSSFNSETENSKHELRDYLFFLHVPRTGGRTYLRCLLLTMNLNPPGCSSLYDEFKFDSRKRKCRLFSSHDDYSVISMLPKERTSVMTIIRNPIERVVGSYEFSLERSSNFMKLDNITSVRRKSRVGRSSKHRLGIWPWKYLFPWMQEDLRARMGARELRGQVHVTTNNPYDMEDFLMPLRDYIYDPMVRDLVHNGATFQIAGLTNYSMFKEAHGVRRCVIKYEDLGHYVLDVAKRRLDNMLFVGLTEKHKESASVFANIVKSQLRSRDEVSSLRPQVTSNDEQSSLLPRNTKSVVGNHWNKTYRNSTKLHPFVKNRPARGNLAFEELIEIYESCASSLKKSQSEKKIYYANFTNETRLLVPEEIIQEIASLNSLDVELYNYAQQIFAKQQERVSKNESSVPTSSETTFVFTCVGQPSYWIFLSLVFITALFLLLRRLLSFNLRRISSKVKL